MQSLVPSVWDLATDYRFAENLEDDSLRSLSYMFISLPGIVYFGFLTKKVLDCCCYNEKVPTWLGNILEKGVGLLVWGSVLSGVVVVLFSCVWIKMELITAQTAAAMTCVMKFLAMTVGTGLLVVKVLGVLVHTDSMRMINVKATHYEGVYESALHLSLVLYVKLSDRGELDIPTMLSSLLMIGKSGAESFLTFGAENKLAARKYFLSQLMLMAKFSPPFLLTALFRISSLSLCFACNDITFYLILPVALFLPILVFTILKLSGHLPDLVVADLAKGTAGELTSIVLWGNTGREGSKMIQLWLGGYLLLTYTVFLVMVLALPKGTFYTLYSVTRAPLELVVVALICGYLGYMMFIYQLFFFDQYTWEIGKKIQNLILRSDHVYINQYFLSIQQTSHIQSTSNS